LEEGLEALWRGGEVGGVMPSHPIRYTFPACCASTASGAARMAMALVVMNVRRSIIG
jgi:hypothetical protein